RFIIATLPYRRPLSYCAIRCSVVEPANGALRVSEARLSVRGGGRWRLGARLDAIERPERAVDLGAVALAGVAQQVAELRLRPRVRLEADRPEGEHQHAARHQVIVGPR